MKTTTKEIITRETVAKELHSLNRASIRSSAVLCAAYFPICSALVLVCVGLTVAALKNPLARILVCTIPCLAVSFPVLLAVISLCRALGEKQQLLRGNFRIVSRTVSYKSEICTRRQELKMLHFVGGDEKVAVDDTTYALAEEGDIFYLVIYPSKRLNVQRLYAADLYEYTDGTDTV